MGTRRQTKKLTFGARLGLRARALREERKLSQLDVARAADMSASKLCDLERGRGPAVPGADKVAKLASALGVSVDALLAFDAASDA